MPPPARPARRAPADNITTPGAVAEILADTRILSLAEKIQLLPKIGIKDNFDR